MSILLLLLSAAVTANAQQSSVKFRLCRVRGPGGVLGAGWFMNISNVCSEMYTYTNLQHATSLREVRTTGNPPRKKNNNYAYTAFRYDVENILNLAGSSGVGINYFNYKFE